MHHRHLGVKILMIVFIISFQILSDSVCPLNAVWALTSPCFAKFWLLLFLTIVSPTAPRPQNLPLAVLFLSPPLELWVSDSLPLSLDLGYLNISCWLP